MRLLRLLVVLLPVLLGGRAWAVQPDEVLHDPKLEARARSLSEELRCLVCQNQSIDDSAAPLARDLRLLVRERLEAGDSDKDVKRYLVERYGDFILLKPPFDGQTVLLWIMPVVVLGGAVLVILLNRRRDRAAPPPLSATEVEQLGRVLGRQDSRPELRDIVS